MLIHFDSSKKITWYHPTITQSDAESKLDSNTIWTDQTIPEVELTEGQLANFYYINGEIVAEITEAASTYTQTEINEAVVALAEVL